MRSPLPSLCSPSPVEVAVSWCWIAEGEFLWASSYFYSSTALEGLEQHRAYVPGLLSTAPVTRHCVWLGPSGRNHGDKASTHALLPAVCSRGSRLRRSPGMDASPPAAQALALPFPRPSCPGVPWLLSPKCTPRRLQRGTYTSLHTELTRKQASHLPGTALGYLQGLPWPQHGLQAEESQGLLRPRTQVLQPHLLRWPQ